MRLRIGTRGSRLARYQTGEVARRLAELGHEVETRIVRTSGDRKQEVPFAQVGPAGVFVVELERALLESRIDLAVHSYKDLPSESPRELVVAAVPERVDPADVLLVREDAWRDDAPHAAGPIDLALPLGRGARVGTASARRQAWLRGMRPDLSIEMLRGNLPTRLRKLGERRHDAILLAAAGLDRLARQEQQERQEQHGHAAREASRETPREATGERPPEPLPLGGIRRMRLDPARFVPAPSQGAIAVQTRRDDDAVREAVAALDHEPAHRAVRAERELLRLVEGGCSLPFGAWCREAGQDEQEDKGEAGGDGRPAAPLSLLAMLGTPSGLLRFRAAGDDPLELARVIWKDLRGPVEAMR